MKTLNLVRSLLLASAMSFAVPAAAEHTPPEAIAMMKEPKTQAAFAAPARGPEEGKGPFRKMAIRGAILIDGSGAPPRGPVDIIIENNLIKEIRQAGTPGLALKPGKRAPFDTDYELDATGMYIMPGFIDMHVHGSSSDKAPDMGYSYKLWMAHGITSVRGVPLAPWSVANGEKNRSARNEIVAPRIFNYQRPGDGWSGGEIITPAQGRAWVQWAAKNNVDGIKLLMSPTEGPEVVKAIIDEAKKVGLGTVAHISQNGVALMDAREAGLAGLGSVTHFYGHMESLLEGSVQDFTTDYNFNDEQHRFGQVADIWDKTFEPGSPEWIEYLQEQKANNVTFDPTMTIYGASRDLTRARNDDWHAKYTMPQMWQFFQSSRENHGSYFFDWTTKREVQWRHFYGRYMTLLNDYKNMGGRVTTGTDSGFIFKTYGFSFPEEMELLQEAGFNPLEVVQAATMNGATTLYEAKGQVEAPMGLVRIGKLADLVIVKENPLQNIKTLYGTGALRLNEQTQELDRVGGVSYTVKDGIVYDAKKLLEDVAAMVVAEKKRFGMPEQGLPLP